MSVALLRLIKQSIEWRPFTREEVGCIPGNTRGIYVLSQSKKRDIYNVMYIGMSGAPRAGVRGRLRGHLRSRTKSKFCTHFSIFEVHDNVLEDEVKELEGILRHIFRKDSRVNQLAGQTAYGKLKSRKVRRKRWDQWSP